MRRRIVSIILSVAMILTMAPYVTLPYTFAYADTEQNAAAEEEVPIADPAADAVARVGDTEYETLQQAVDAVPTAGTVTVLSDILLTSSLRIPQNRFTIDLNGHTIANAESFVTSSDNPLILRPDSYLGGSRDILTLKNGVVYTRYDYAINSASVGGVTLENMEVEARGSVAVSYRSNFYYLISNSTVSSGSGVALYADSGTVDINGSTVHSDGTAAIECGSNGGGNGTINVNSGTVSGGQYGLHVTHNTNTNISGGTVSGTKYGLFMGESSSSKYSRLHVIGGTITGAEASLYAAENGIRDTNADDSYIRGGEFHGAVEGGNVKEKYLISGGTFLTSDGSAPLTLNANLIVEGKVQDSHGVIRDNEDFIVLEEDSVTYDGAEHTPSVMVEGIDGSDHTADYDFSYTLGDETVTAPFVQAGEYTVTATHKETEQALTAVYTINPKPMSTFTVEAEDIPFTGAAVTADYTVKEGGADAGLTEGQDYTVALSDDMTNAGDKTITLTGQGNYTGTITGSFQITPAAMSAVRFTLEQNEYLFEDGRTYEPSVTGTLTTGAGESAFVYTLKDTDYTVTYEDNDKAGTANAVITAGDSGNFTGSVSVPFTLKQAAATITNGEETIYYATLPEAFAAAADGDTITVKADLDLTEVNIITLTNKKVTLDLAGFTLSCGSNRFARLFDINGAQAGLTVKDTSAEETGKIAAPSVLYVNDGSFTLESGTLECTSQDRGVMRTMDGTANITIKGGKIISGPGSDSVAIMLNPYSGYYSDSTLTIEGGEIIGKTNATAIYVVGTGLTVNITGGTITATGAQGKAFHSHSSVQPGNTISISGGTFNGAVTSDARGFITGGTFSAALAETGYVAKGYYQNNENTVVEDALLLPVASASAVYDGTDKTPTYADFALESGTDLANGDVTVRATKDGSAVTAVKDVGTYELKATYAGRQYTFDFTVTAADLGGLTVQDEGEHPFTGFAYTLEDIRKEDISFKDSLGQPVNLTENDFDITDVQGTEAGLSGLTVTIQGKGNYSGTKVFGAPITPANFADIAWTLEYDTIELDPLAPRKPSVSGVLTTAKGNYEIPSDDYSVAYTDNDKVGTATVTITNEKTARYSGESAEKTFQITDAPAVATITRGGETLSYVTLAEAVEAANDGETITVVKDFTLPNIPSSGAISVSVDKTITLDLAGKTITKAGINTGIAAVEGGVLTITDSSQDGTGTYTADSGTAIGVVDGGTLIVEGGHLTGTAGIGVKGDSSLIINGGTIEATKYSAVSIGDKGDSDTPEVTINGGTLTGTEFVISDAMGYSTITVNGGTMSANGEGAGFINMSAPNTNAAHSKTITIADGSVTVPGTLFNIDSRSRQTINIDITGGTLTSTDANAIDLAAAKTTINISGGTIKTTAADSYAIKTADHASATTGTSVSITGGTVIGTAGAVQAECQSQSPAEFITGGYFSHAVDEAYMPAGYTCGAVAPGTEAPYIVQDSVGFVAIGETPYDSLQAAIDAAAESGDTIVLLKDVVFAESDVKATVADKSVTFDLNGHFYKTPNAAAVEVAAGGALTIKDSTEEGAGLLQGGTALDDQNSSTIRLSAETAKLTVESGNIRGGYNAIRATDLDSVTVSGGLVEGYGYGFYNARDSISGHTVLTMTGGTILAGKDASLSARTYQQGYGVWLESGDVAVTGGVIQGRYGIRARALSANPTAPVITVGGDAQIIGEYSGISSATYAGRGATINVEGGTVTATSKSSGTGIYAADDSFINISGGTVSGYEYAVRGGYTNTVTVTGGTIKLEEGFNQNSTAYGIDIVTGTIEISGNALIDATADGNAKTIGVVNSRGKVLNITGGTIKAATAVVTGTAFGSSNAVISGGSIEGSLTGVEAYGGSLTVSGNAAVTGETGIRVYGENAVVNIGGGTVSGTANGIYKPASGNAEINLQGGTLTGGEAMIKSTGGTTNVNMTAEEGTFSGGEDGIAVNAGTVTVSGKAGLRAGKNGILVNEGRVEFTADTTAQLSVTGSDSDSYAVKVNSGNVTIRGGAITNPNGKGIQVTGTEYTNTNYSKQALAVFSGLISSKGDAVTVLRADSNNATAEALIRGGTILSSEGAGIYYNVADTMYGLFVGYMQEESDPKPVYITGATGIKADAGLVQIADQAFITGSTDALVLGDGVAAENETTHDKSFVKGSAFKCGEDGKVIVSSIEGFVEGGIFSAEPDASLIADGLAAVPNTDAETKAEYPYMVGVEVHELTKTEAKAATCTEAGNVEYYTCSICGKYFSDAEGETEITKEDTVIAMIPHSLSKVEAKKPTHKVTGNTEHYKCENCGALFLDAEGTQPATSDDVLLKRGWLLEDGEWHYYDGEAENDKGTRRCNAWAQDSVGWCWLDAEGNITKSKWIKDNGEWYYLKANGYMAAKEWAKDSKGWLYMEGSGKAAKSKWIQYKGEWYYLKSNGYMAANEWAKDSKGWLYMEGSGKPAKSKWIQYKGSWYYLNASGYMVTGTQTINGKTYRFDSSGKWIK